MQTNHFSTNSNGHCTASRVVPDEKSIKMVLASAKKKPQKASTVIIARYKWLQKYKLPVPAGVDLPNLCVMVKEGKLKRAFYSNVLTHVIKKQNYTLQILN